jgi:chromosome segregation ATPase
LQEELSARVAELENDATVTSKELSKAKTRAGELESALSAAQAEAAKWKESAVQLASEKQLLESDAEKIEAKDRAAAETERRLAEQLESR